MQEFIQKGPQLPTNLYLSDHLLRDYLQCFLSPEVFDHVNSDLTHFGARVSGDILAMAQEAEANLPEHIVFDEWGNRIDKIRVARGWEELHQVAAEEGLIAIGYERQLGEYSRLYQFAKNFLFCPSSAFYSCPLAMTDGAAKLIELFGDKKLKKEVLPRLTSRDGKKFWTSGQWMTEKTGGSDVGQGQTIAKFENGQWRLYGAKWFTSAITAPMAMTLARIEDEKGQSIPGGRGLSLFYLEKLDQHGNSNNIEILRLKDKLGTRALPTAELRLNGAHAHLVGETGKGVKTIATLFNITRIHNALNAASFSRRLMTLALDYAPKRQAFKKSLDRHPLHVATLWDLEVECQAAFHLVFYAARLLGASECSDKNSQHYLSLLRLITPVVKLYTAKQNLKITSEVIESFGGVGYLEDSGFGKWLRDGQTLAIWEGTTNVLALDLLRSIEKDLAFAPWQKEICGLLQGITNPQLQASKNKVEKEFEQVSSFLESASSRTDNFLESSARNFAYSVARVSMAALMLDFAERSKDLKRAAFYHACAIAFAQKKLNLTSQSTPNIGEKELPFLFQN